MISISDELIDQKKAREMSKQQQRKDKRETFRRDSGSSMVPSPGAKPLAAQRSQPDPMEQIQHKTTTEEDIPMPREEKNSFMSGGVKLQQGHNKIKSIYDRLMYTKYHGQHK
jgi:hypothetical protein